MKIKDRLLGAGAAGVVAFMGVTSYTTSSGLGVVGFGIAIFYMLCVYEE